MRQRISTPRSSFIALRGGASSRSRERRADCSDRHTYKTDIEQRFRRKQARGRLNGDWRTNSVCKILQFARSLY
jgi:hypothetical protein